jgi:hypothetical protein
MTNPLTKYEINQLSKALRVRTKAAKLAILAMAPKLKNDFEIQLKTLYPPDGDPVWKEEFNALRAEYQKRQARVEQRCEELNIPKRFRPKFIPHGWNYGDHHYFKAIRDEYRRFAYLQIDELIKSKVAALEQESAEVECQILVNAFLTDAAKDFFKRLPTIAALVQPVKIEEFSALLDGRSLPSNIPGLPSPVLEAALPPIDDEEKEPQRFARDNSEP